MYWFTSDEHFNHENILKLFVYRPFRSVDEMNTTIIQRHNARVKDNDVVFHLGDFKLTTKGSNPHKFTVTQSQKAQNTSLSCPVASSIILSK